MKITLNLPHRVYFASKSCAAMRDETVNEFILEAVRDKLAAEQNSSTGYGGWRAVFGKAALCDVHDVQQILDAKL